MPLRPIAEPVSSVVLCAAFALAGAMKAAEPESFESALAVHGVIPSESASVLAQVIIGVEVCLSLVSGVSTFHRAMRPWAGVAALTFIGAAGVYIITAALRRTAGAPCGCGLPWSGSLAGAGWQLAALALPALVLYAAPAGNAGRRDVTA